MPKRKERHLDALVHVSMTPTLHVCPPFNTCPPTRPRTRLVRPRSCLRAAPTPPALLRSPPTYLAWLALVRIRNAIPSWNPARLSPTAHSSCSQPVSRHLFLQPDKLHRPSLDGRLAWHSTARRTCVRVLEYLGTWNRMYMPTRTVQRRCFAAVLGRKLGPAQTAVSVQC